MDALRSRTRGPWIGLLLLASAITAGLLLLRGGGGGPPRALTAPGAASPPVEETAIFEETEREAAPRAPELEARSMTGREEPDLTAPDPRNTLRGRTVDEEGAPLSGVRVTFRGTLISGNGERTLGRSATSGPDGTFVLRGFRPFQAKDPPAAELAGHTLLHASPLERGVDGAWRPVLLVLGAGATLEVTLVDDAGAPLPGRVVTAGPVAAELGELERRFGDASLVTRQRERATDLAGRAVFELPAHRLLEVRARIGDEELVRTRCAGGRLTDEADAEPLVLAPGERRRVELRAGITLRLAGVVLDARRAPVPTAHVRVLDGEPEESGTLDSLHDLRTDEVGRFELTLRGLAREDVLTLLAADGQWIAMSEGSLSAATRLRVEVAEALARPAPLELVLEDLLAISGRVVDEAGEAPSVVVWAVPSGADYVLQKGELGFLPLSFLRGEPGAFEIPALRPGPHDVIVKRNDPRTYHRFPGIQAGTRDLVLVIEDDRVVELRLVVENARTDDRLWPMVLWHQLRDSDGFGRRAPASPIALDACDEARWPADALRGWHGGIRRLTVEHARGRTLVLLEQDPHALAAGQLVLLDPSEQRRSRAIELEPRQVGCYSVGLRAHDAEGRAYARLLTEPLWLDAGETTLVARLELAATLEGRASIAPGEDLRLELRDEKGQLVRSPDGERWTTLTADGGFHVEELPPGLLEARVGTPAELAGGRWRRRESVRLAPGELARLEL